MTPDQIIAALEKEGEMQNVVQMSRNEYQGTRKGKTITAKVTKYRGQWQLINSNRQQPFGAKQYLSVARGDLRRPALVRV